MTDILIVEDDADLAELLGIVTKQMGFTVHECCSGFDALRWLNDNKPKLILLDYFMPKLNGEMFLASLPESRKDVPVIFLSGADFVGELGREWLQKPASFDQIESAILRYIKQLETPKSGCFCRVEASV